MEGHTLFLPLMVRTIQPFMQTNIYAKQGAPEELHCQQIGAGETGCACHRTVRRRRRRKSSSLLTTAGIGSRHSVGQWRISCSGSFCTAAQCLKAASMRTFDSWTTCFLLFQVPLNRFTVELKLHVGLWGLYWMKRFVMWSCWLVTTSSLAAWTHVTVIPQRSCHKNLDFKMLKAAYLSFRVVLLF